MSYINHFTTNIIYENFQYDLLCQHNIIEEKEMKILLALGDALDEQENYDNFVKDSLTYLKNNYGLTNGVWKVLLNLYDKIPNFTTILSTWKITNFALYSEDFLLKTNIPHNNLPLYSSWRNHSLQHLFLMIDSLLPHFCIDEICELIPLISNKFDYENSYFSISNIEKKCPNMTRDEKRLIQSFFNSRHFTLTNLLKNLHDEFYYSHKSYKGNKQQYIEGLDSRLSRIGVEFTNSEETFLLIRETFSKYTDYPFLSYLGLKDISEKIIDKEDKYLVLPLITEYKKSFSDAQGKVISISYLLKILYNYKQNIEKGFEKILTIIDYIRMSNDYNIKISHNSNFKVKDLLTWSNNWHVNGEYMKIKLGEIKDFKNFDINHAIEDYQFIQLTNTYELHNEGKLQKHCVYTYMNKCLKNQTIIVSMRNKDNNIISTLRFEFFYKKSLLKKQKIKSIKLVENRKKLNKSCSPSERKVAYEYEKYIQKKMKSITF